MFNDMLGICVLQLDETSRLNGGLFLYVRHIAEASMNSVVFLWDTVFQRDAVRKHVEVSLFLDL